MTTGEIESYYDRVRAALDGLEPQLRDDLLEDLPDHLAEVLAEGDGSLRDRLGAPEAYADELRAAAGVEPVTAAPHGLHQSVHRGLARATDLARRFDVQAGRFVGYPRLMDLLRGARPGWWVLRGWIAAQFVSGSGRPTWGGLIAPFGGNVPAGLVCTITAIGVSVWIGRRSVAFAPWPRRIMAAASTVIALWAVLVLAESTGSSYAYTSPDGSTPYGSQINDIYVYDKDGNAVPGARLFDQDGNPIHIGATYCLDGNPATGAGPDATAVEWTYPLCTTSTAPFRSGPGPLPGAARATPTAPLTGASAPPARGRTSTATSTATASPSR